MITLKDLNKRFGEDTIQHIVEMLTRHNDLLEAMMEGYVPEPRPPWHKRWLAYFGDTLISWGRKLGGDYESY